MEGGGGVVDVVGVEGEGVVEREGMGGGGEMGWKPKAWEPAPWKETEREPWENRTPEPAAKRPAGEVRIVSYRISFPVRERAAP